MSVPGTKSEGTAGAGATGATAWATGASCAVAPPSSPVRAWAPIAPSPRTTTAAVETPTRVVRRRRRPARMLAARSGPPTTSWVARSSWSRRSCSTVMVGPLGGLGFGEHGLQAVEGAGGLALDRALRDVEDAGHLDDRQVVEEPQGDDGPRPGREPGQRGHEVEPREPAVRAGHRPVREPVGGALATSLPGHPEAGVHQGPAGIGVDGAGVDPRPVHVELRERRLHGILGGGPAAEDGVGRAHQRALPAHEVVAVSALPGR